MKTPKTLFTLLLSFGMVAESFAQAELQVIHNSADPAASTVDIYINGSLTLNDFAFREATPYLQVPSGVQLDIGVAPGNSTSANDTLVNIPVTLVQNQRYVAIASGVLNPGSFTSNPNAVSTGFQLIISDNMRIASLNPGEVDLKVLHGCTDAPTVDVLAQGVATLVDDATYTDFTPYISVPAGDYLLDVTPGNNNSIVVATFSAELNGLGGGAAVVFASGFLDANQNPNAEFGLFAALPNGTVVTLNKVGTARLQVIHNAADPAAATVDIYANGNLLLDNFNFREATPFIDVNSGQTLNIGIAPGSSTGINDTLVNIPVVLNDGETYVAVASGVLSPASFAANPEGINTAFQLLLFSGMQEVGLNGTDVDVAVLHGATDAPAVDVFARNVAQLIDSITYTELNGYINVPAADYLLDITPSGGTPIIATYLAPLSGLSGGAAVVFASGFLDPSVNQNGAAFGLFAALADGTVIELNDTSNSRLQVIHNCADPAANQVDVYVNGALLLNDFAFRTATPYIDVPSNATLNIGIAPGNSNSVNDTLVNIPVVLANGETYVAVANGVLSPASFAANPEGINTAFQLLLFSGMQEVGLNGTDVDVAVLHGATDAPAVDVFARNVAQLIDSITYTELNGYINVPAADYLLDITPSGGTPIIATYLAPLSGLSGGAAVVFASGFLDPSVNQNGAAFGLFAALADGTVIELNDTSNSRLQVIHNCADPAANQVDVYVNGALLLNDFAFRTATPYIDVPSNVTINIGIAPGTSASVNDTLVNIPVVLANGGTYLAVASGVLSPASFAVNPDGRPTNFQLLLQDQMRESSEDGINVDFRVLHGSTDAPTVDVVAVGAGVIVDNAAYTDITNYITVPPAAYTLQVTDAINNSVVVAQYSANLSTLGGGAAVVFASGFLTPANNQNGEAFGLYAALADGTVIPFSLTTGLNSIQNNFVQTIYPNPVNDLMNIQLNSDVIAEVATVIDVTGKIVYSMPISNSNSTFTIDVKNLNAGTYFLNVYSNTGEISVQRFNVIK
jgi:hypothetical protein